jgi:hypothetical protein
MSICCASTGVNLDPSRLAAMMREEEVIDISGPIFTTRIEFPRVPRMLHCDRAKTTKTAPFRASLGVRAR